MLKKYTLLLVILVSSFGTAQKKLTKSFDGTNIDTIVINGDGIFSIRVLTAPTTKISVSASIVGETFENTLLTHKEELHTITFGVADTPFFRPENDKLAAHKVMAIQLFIIIPENRTVRLQSNQTNVTASGRFKELQVSLKEGTCTVTDFIGNGTFQTVKGAIIVTALPQVSGTALSEKGTVINYLNTHQPFQISAESTHGDIHLSQIE